MTSASCSPRFVRITRFTSEPDAWLERLLREEDAIIVPDVVWVGFIRLATNSRVFQVPATVSEAFAFADAMCAASAYRRVPGLVDGLDAFRNASLRSESWGNLVPDAYIAAVALSHGCPVASFDRDFRRFDGLSIVVPG